MPPLLLLVTLLIFVLPSTAPNPLDWQSSFTYQNERVGIKCGGDFPQQLAEMLTPMFDPYHGSILMGATYTSLVSVCARSDWGGRPINANGVCSALTPHPYQLLFDKGSSATASLTTIFALFYCATKCHCTTGTSGNPITSLSRFPNMLPQYHVYNMLDETTGEVVLIADFNPLLEEGRYFMTIPTILRPSTGGAASYSVLVTGLADNRIVCEGGVPPFTFVAGQDLYYTDLLAVCAGSIYGGNNLGNLGGSCGRTASGGYLLTFSSVLRHPEAEGPYASLLKLYCATKCKCKDDPTNHSDFLMSDENGPITITDLDNGVFEARDIDGRAATFTATHRANNRVDVSVVTRPSSACSMTDCKKPLLDLVLCADPSQTLCRPVNTAFINTTTTLPDPVESIRKVQRGSEPAVCPNKVCTSSRQCEGCKCKVNPRVTRVDNSGQSTFLQAHCGHAISLAMLAITGEVSKARGAGGSKGSWAGSNKRRDLEADSEHRLVDDGEAPCACNGSYVSYGCCGDHDGMVWESPVLKLGILA